MRIIVIGGDANTVVGVSRGEVKRAVEEIVSAAPPENRESIPVIEIPAVAPASDEEATPEEIAAAIAASEVKDNG